MTSVVGSGDPMSTRTALRPQVVISAGDMTQTLTSAPTVMQSLSGVSYSYSWTGSSPVGTLSVQVSNDYALEPNGTVANAGTWNTLTLNLNGAPVTSIPVSGSPGTAAIDILKTMFYAIRTIYTPGSGTGSLTATVSGKVS